MCLLLLLLLLLLNGSPSSQMWFFVQLCSSWQDFNWLKASRGLSAAADSYLFSSVSGSSREAVTDVITLYFRWRHPHLLSPFVIIYLASLLHFILQIRPASYSFFCSKILAMCCQPFLVRERYCSRWRPCSLLSSAFCSTHGLFMVLILLLLLTIYGTE